MNTEYTVYQTRSGLKYSLDPALHNELMFTGPYGVPTLEKFEILVMASELFPQINRFIATVIGLFLGYISFKSILLINILVGIISMFIWNNTPLYKIGFLSTGYCFVGQTVFRLMLHIVLLGCLAFFVFHNWLILLYALVAGFFAQFLEASMNGYRHTYKRNNAMARYAIKSMLEK